MSTLTKALCESVRKAEDTALAEKVLQSSRLTHHLMPPTGWLNDPNGLCYFKGRYHIFFQYAPFDPEGGLKFWGHYSSKDMLEWKYEGVALYPDSVMDCHGVYSGSALVEEDKMHLFFTGNIKEEDGDYDYINNGRQSSTLHVESEDGIQFGRKEAAVYYKDYPENYTCHIRDPKVWKDANGYHMVLGGRRKDDHGAVLFYRSEDLKHWEYDRELTTERSFGYMWECPDFFGLSGEKVLSVSPQGLKREEYRFQNIYQSGYFILKNDSVAEEDFQEWDMGFDFYAPQTFQDEKGRRILVGWMGMPDADEEYTNPTAAEEGWQHCLTLPREITLKNGRLYQNPVEEIKSLRGKAAELDTENRETETEGSFDLEVQVSGNEISVDLGENLFFTYKDRKAVLSLSEETGAGRTVRKAEIPSEKLENIRILGDTTAAEIYLNDGEVVFSTRYYPKNRKQILKISAQQIKGKLYQLASMTFTK